MRKFAKSNSFFKKVRQIIPLASQTFSKSYINFVKGQAPLFLTHGKGAYVWDIDGNKYVDLINGLLPVILGYQYPAVDAAIRAQLKKAMILSQASPLEYELAKLLRKHIPCAEMARFGKNGSDVTTGAIRLARAVTGREHVAICEGHYHGWHDWYIGSTTRNLGVPESARKLTHKFKYNDPKSLEKILKRWKIAAVIMEPMNTEEPRDNFLKKVMELAHRHGALLVFDEVITGFRYGLGGAQRHFGVVPDLACFGKSMGNGAPISALVGKRRYMRRLEDVFYSFTFGGELLSIAAAIAVIREMERKPILQEIWKRGRWLQDQTNLLLQKHDLSEVITVKGKPCWQVFAIKGSKGSKGGKGLTDLEIKSFLQQEMLQNGFLWHGQHNMSYAHSMSDLRRLVVVYDRAFAQLRKYLSEGSLRQHLRGKPISSIFKVR